MKSTLGNALLDRRRGTSRLTPVHNSMCSFILQVVLLGSFCSLAQVPLYQFKIPAVFLILSLHMHKYPPRLPLFQIDSCVSNCVSWARLRLHSKSS